MKGPLTGTDISLEGSVDSYPSSSSSLAPFLYDTPGFGHSAPSQFCHATRSSVARYYRQSDCHEGLGLNFVKNMGVLKTCRRTTRDRVRETTQSPRSGCERPEQMLKREPSRTSFRRRTNGVLSSLYTVSGALEERIKNTPESMRALSIFIPEVAYSIWSTYEGSELCRRVSSDLFDLLFPESFIYHSRTYCAY